MGFIKASLLGRKVSFIKKGYQSFGTNVHERFLLGKAKTKVKLTTVEKKQIEGMLKALRANVIVNHLMEDTVCEVTRKEWIDGVLLQFTPDAVKLKKTGLDLKTTACDDEQDFIYKAFGYGYFRQGETYSRAAKLKEFYIIGITKGTPHQVWIILINAPEHRVKMAYVKQELDFLLYFFKNYGNFSYLEKEK